MPSQDINTKQDNKLAKYPLLLTLFSGLSLVTRRAGPGRARDLPVAADPAGQHGELEQRAFQCPSGNDAPGAVLHLVRADF